MNVQNYRKTMKEKKRTETLFKKPSALSVKIPNPEDVPYSPSYRRLELELTD